MNIKHENLSKKFHYLINFFSYFLWAQGTYTMIKIRDLEVKIWDGLKPSWKSLRYIREGLRVSLKPARGSPAPFEFLAAP